ncbi:hypothetical protein [Nocardia sp. NPDC060259]|uniref:hypothetical protein n=1 Tax=Nocardia sp. NPDC060259 TaxID=3347088 RepID=UPI003649A9EA
MTAYEPRGIPGGGENARSWRHREIAAAFAPLEVTDAVAQADRFARIARLWEDGVAAFERATRDSAGWSGAAADASSAAVGRYVAQARELTAVLDQFSGLVRTAADAIVATRYAIPEQIVAEVGPPLLATGQAESHRSATAALEDARLAMRERYVVPFGEVDARIPVLPMPSRRDVPGGDSDDRLVRGGRSAEIFGAHSGSGAEGGFAQSESLDSPHSTHAARLRPAATGSENVVPDLATSAPGGASARSDDGSAQGGDPSGAAGSAGPGDHSAGAAGSAEPNGDSTVPGDSSVLGSDLAGPGNDSAGPHGGSTGRGDRPAGPGGSSVGPGGSSVGASDATVTMGPAFHSALFDGLGLPGTAAGAATSVVDPTMTSMGHNGSAHSGGAQPALAGAPAASGDQSARGTPSLPAHDAEPLRPGAGRSMPGAAGSVVGANSPTTPSPTRVLDRLFHYAVPPCAGQTPDSEAERVLPDYLITQANTDALLGNPRPTVSGGVIGGGDGGWPGTQH